MPITTYLRENEWQHWKDQHEDLPEKVREPLAELNRREGDCWRVVALFDRRPWWKFWGEPDLFYQVYFLPDTEWGFEAQIMTCASGDLSNTGAYVMGRLGAMDNYQKEASTHA